METNVYIECESYGELKKHMKSINDVRSKKEKYWPTFGTNFYGINLDLMHVELSSL